MKCKRSEWLVMLLTVGRLTPAVAKELFVGPGGNVAVSHAQNSRSSPWATLGRAAWGSTTSASANPSQAAQPGDVVLVAAGTYSAPGTNRKEVPAFNPVNSGTPTQPIQFRAQGVVDLQLSSGAGATIGAYGVDYIAWQGPFRIGERAAPSLTDMGPVVFADTEEVAARNLGARGHGRVGARDACFPRPQV